MSVKYMKITYCAGEQKINAYINNPSPTFMVLKADIEMCLFEQRKQPRSELRIFWLDEDNDEIDIINQCDYDIFLCKRDLRHHLQVAPLNAAKPKPKTAYKNDAEATATEPTNDDPAAFVIHQNVQCDSCLVQPIVGFRYKCVQCSNFDLCQKCEAQHKHAHHMMLRMPHDDCPRLVDTFITSGGRNAYRRNKRSREQCPFAAYAAPTTESANEGAGEGAEPKDGRHGHRHGHKFQRRLRNSFFTHLYDMMQDLAEGGASSKNEDAEKAAEATKEAAAAAEQAANKAAEAAITVAQEFASQAATFCAAAKAASEQPTAPPNEEDKENVSTNATPKTPPSTPNAGEPKGTQPDGNNAAQNVPVIPGLENFAAFLDPNFMKNGIAILNNFSEMFGKILDPADGVGMSCPFDPAAYGQRKNSTKSNASATSTSSSTVTPKSAAAEQPNDKVSAAENDNVTPSTSAEASLVAPPVVTPAEERQTPERRRSQSEEGDWQLIDKQASDSSVTTISGASSSEGIDAAGEAAGAAALPAAGASTPSAPAAPEINYKQLSQDLRNHIEQENAREKETQNKATTTETLTAAATESTATAAINASNANREAAEAIAAAEEKRTKAVYHTAPHINRAVHAMIAMGFSNEGAWLTQLLESVGGDISKALDLMSAAQRSGF